MTHTLSDYPLLIGEILRRDQLRARQQARRRAIFSDLQRALGMRVAQAVGTQKTPSAGWTWRHREGSKGAGS
jgi:hypothetical protein